MLFADTDVVQIINAVGVVIGAVGAIVAGYFAYKIKAKQLEIESAQLAANAASKKAADTVASKVSEVRQDLLAHQVAVEAGQDATHARLDRIEDKSDTLVKQTNGMSEQLQKVAFAAGVDSEKRRESGADTARA
jgi:hypothetical protein